MKRGFTLLELIVVIVILGILATLGYSQYTLVVEQGRTAEAKAILSSIRSAEITYKFENGVYAETVSQLTINAPTSCTNTHYFSYSIQDAGSANSKAAAYRCTSGGKTPDYSHSYALKICLQRPGNYAIWYPEATAAPFWSSTNWGCDAD